MSASDQARDKVGADVAGGSDDEDATHFASLARPHPDTGPWQATSSSQDRRIAGGSRERERFTGTPTERHLRSEVTWDNGSQHSGSRGLLTRKGSQVQTLSRPPHRC